MTSSPTLAAVTGATGHLGNVLARRLLEEGAAVRALVQPGDDPVALEGLAVEQVPGDVLDLDALRRAFRGAEVVYHLAAVVSISRGAPGKLQAINVQGTRNVLEACRAAGVRRLVHVGSVHALAVGGAGLLDEAAGFDPLAPGAYARSKAQACLEVQAAAEAGRVDAVLALPSGVLGPFDFRLSEMGQLLMALASGKVPALVKGGFDWVDVRDVALGLTAAARRGRTGEAYLLGGRWASLEELATLVGEETGRRVPPVLPAWVARLASGPASAWEALTGKRALLTPYAVHTITTPVSLSLERARAALDYRPRPLDVTLAETLAWHRASPLSPGNRHLALPGPARRLAVAR